MFILFDFLGQSKCSRSGRSDDREGGAIRGAGRKCLNTRLSALQSLK